MSWGRWLAVEVVTAERVDVRVRDGGDARERGLVGDDVGLGGVEVIDRGRHVAGVPDLDGVDEQLEAEGVAAVVVFVGGVCVREPMTRWRRSACRVSPLLS